MKKTFRPSARLIGTIGEDIIKDMHAAVVELVKNAYDADATKVTITFEETESNELLLSVKDNGHGMSEKVVVEKWFVPSTSDKLIRKTSPGGRIMQGRKGIGRFAVAILGERTQLETVANNMKTTLTIDWNDFGDNKYLDEILIDIYTTSVSLDDGTSFNIMGSKEKLDLWNDREIEYLIKELRKLLTPIDKTNVEEDIDIFEIKINFKNFSSKKYKNESISIKPLPLLDYYDYRISGKICSDGCNSLIYHNRASGTEEKASDFSFHLKDKEKFQGEVEIDFRVFDRDPEAIEKLISVLSESGEEELGKNEAKNLLNDISGIYIFRHKFRIRPYGDERSDWLQLDKKRVQNPAQKIGANQISGIVSIQDEEISRLVEKSARDGLKEDAYYDGLVSIISQVLVYIELRRFTFRRKTGKGRTNHLYSSQLTALTDFTAVKNRAFSVMKAYKVDMKEINELGDFIDKDIEGKVNIAIEIERQIAMYQGQATLGKIMNVVMHEVRKPLQWIKTQTKNIERSYKRYLQNEDVDDLSKVIRLIKETPEQTKTITALFNRLNPLATRSRAAMSVFSLSEAIQAAIDIYENELRRKDIVCKIEMNNDFVFKGWREDILAALANILENAIYWVEFSKEERQIEMCLFEERDSIEISVWNNGPKIITDLLENDSLFDPGISGKITEDGPGTGIGLSIAGEAITRNNGFIKVVEVSQGAKFVVNLPKMEEQGDE